MCDRADALAKRTCAAAALLTAVQDRYNLTDSRAWHEVNPVRRGLPESIAALLERLDQQPEGAMHGNRAIKR